MATQNSRRLNRGNNATSGTISTINKFCEALTTGRNGTLEDLTYRMQGAGAIGGSGSSDSSPKVKGMKVEHSNIFVHQNRGTALFTDDAGMVKAIGYFTVLNNKVLPDWQVINN